MSLLRSVALIGSRLVKRGKMRTMTLTVDYSRRLRSNEDGKSRCAVGLVIRVPSLYLSFNKYARRQEKRKTRSVEFLFI